MEIKFTHIPFMPQIRLLGDEVETELYKEIKKAAARYGKNLSDFTAKFELLPDPRGPEYGHFLVSQVTYLKGKLDEKK